MKKSLFHKIFISALLIKVTKNNVILNFTLHIFSGPWGTQNLNEHPI